MLGLRGCICLLLLASVAEAQSFRNPPIIPTQFDPISIATADFNGDGIPDLAYVDAGVTSNSAPTVHILLGRGDGTFIRGQGVSVPITYCGGCAINVADVNGDGKLDLVLGGGGSSTATVVALLGNGDGTFGAPIVSTFTPANSSSYPSTGRKMAIGDINGDGAADLAIPDPGNTEIYILTGNNAGSFTYSGEIFNGYFPTEAYFADLNGDKKLDLIALGPLGGDVSVYLGNGNGTFASGTNYSLGAGPSNMVLTDLDGDGHLDIVTDAFQSEVGSQLYQKVLFLHGNSDGTFAAPQTIVNQVQGTLIDGADYNGDGIPDLVFASDVGLGIMLGQGKLTYGTEASYPSGAATPPDIAFGTFKTDGYRDVAMGVEGGIVLVMGNGDGAFASVPFYDLGDPVGAAAVADFNGDGNPDMAVTVPAEFPRVLLGKGDGTFQIAADQNTSYGTGKPALSLAVGDFTGKHVEDLVGPSSGGPVATNTPEVLYGKGDGTFSAPVEEDSASTAVADLNGDGIADMVSVSGDDITVLLGTANGTFTTVQTQLREPTFAKLVAVGDVNRDGKPDLVISDIAGVEVWLDNGDGTFTYKGMLNASPAGTYNVGGYGSAAIADLDGDGNPDLVFIPSSQGSPLFLPVYYGNGDGTFAAPVLLPVSHAYTALVAADVNGDGKPDLILSNGGGIGLMRNVGGKTFAPEEHYVAGSGIGTVSVADLNHDGYPDIVATDSSGTTVAVLLNQPSIPYAGGSAAMGTLALSPEPSLDMQPFQMTLTLASPTQGGATPTGTVAFSIDGEFVAEATLNAGVASFTSSRSLSPGVHTVTAAYNGDQNYRFASYFALHTVNPPVYSTSTALTITPISVLTSQTVHIQATVTAIGNTPIGYVTFLDGGQTLAAVQLNSSGIAYFDTALLAVGTHSIVAQYDGYTSQNSYNPEVFSSSSSAPATVMVSDIPSVTTLSTSSASPTSGTILTLTATVSSAAGTPFGGVTFFDATTQLGTSSLDGGQATFSSASLATGQHAFTAVYGANATWAGSTSQQQSVDVQAVSGRLIRTFTSVSAAPSSAGHGIQVAALVSSATAAPQGSVTFLMDGTVLGSAPADQNGNVTLLSTAAPAGGQHQFWASYGGSAVYAPSVSPALDWSPQSAASGFSLNLDANTVQVWPSSTATVHVLISAPARSSETISLSCAAGLPQGHTCDFSPASLTAPGVSTLTISAYQRSQRTSGANWWRKGALGISLSLLIFLPFVKRRRLRWSVLMLALSLVVVMPSGCSVTGLTPRANEVSVLVVRASAGTGSNASVNSAQLTIYTRR